MKAQLAEAEHAIARAQDVLDKAQQDHMQRVQAAEDELKAALAEHERDLQDAHDTVVKISDQMSGLICRAGQVSLFRDRLEVGMKALPLTDDLEVSVLAVGQEHKGPYKEPVRLGSSGRQVTFVARNAQDHVSITINPDHEKQLRNLAACVKPECERVKKRMEILKPQLKEALRRRDLVEQDRYRISVATAEVKHVREDRAEVEKALFHLELAMRKKLLVQFRLKTQDKMSAIWKKITSGAGSNN